MPGPLPSAPLPSSPSPRRLRPWRAVAWLAVTCLGLAASLSAAQEFTGRTASGAWFRIEAPQAWQPGDGLVLVNHGYDFRDPDGPPSLGPQALRQRQLAQGWALAASGYSERGWALFATAEDHRQLLEEFRARLGEPGRIIATGGSLGGLVALQQAAQPELGEVMGVYALCTPAAGSRVWDRALDLRLSYDAICADVDGGRLPRGEPPLEYAIDAADLGDFDSWLKGSRSYLAINRCTGIDLPSWAVSDGMRRRLQQLLEVNALDREFLLDNMAYALFGLSDLVRSPLKLNGTAALGNQYVDYGDPQLAGAITRHRADRLAALELKLNYSPRGSLGQARILSTHTSGDGLVTPSNQHALSALLPAERLHIGYVREAQASHCGYSDAELLAGWETLRRWVVEDLQPDAGSLQAACVAEALPGAAGACRYDADYQPPPLQQTLRPRQRPAFAVQAASSGLWFDPATPGDGYVIEALADGRAVVARFSYPAAGESADQAWFLGTGEIIDEAIVIESMQRPVGARFGAAFDPAQVRREAWGRQRFVFPACGEGESGWQAVAPFDGGRQALRQLTWIGANGCPANASGPANASAAVATDLSTTALSGAWFDPQRSGEGGFLHLQADGRGFLLWFSYRPQGGQAWFYGEGQWDQQGIDFNPLLRPTGVRFGAFDPAAVDFRRWGSLRIDFLADARLRLRYEADDPAWGSGELLWQRLTQPLPGADAAPATLSGLH